MAPKRGTEAYERWCQSEGFRACRDTHIGRQFTDEHRQKLSEARKRRVTSEDTKFKMSRSLRQVLHTKDWHKRIGDRLRGRHLSEDTKVKLAEAHRGKHHTEESKAKMRALFPEERRQYLADLARGKRASVQTRAKMSIKHTGHRHTTETVEKLRRPHGHHSPEHIHKVLSRSRRHPNGLERQMTAILDRLFPGEWRFTGDGSLVINHGNPDFANVNGQKKLIEVYGDYWHRGENPEQRIVQFREFGWETLVIWEHEVKGDQMQLEERLRAFCEYH